MVTTQPSSDNNIRSRKGPQFHKFDGIFKRTRSNLSQRASEATTAPQSRKLNILFYGAGVLGSLYAAKLYEAGHNVTVLARGQRLADLREHGIVLENARTGEHTTTHVRVTERLLPEDEYDWVIVLVRKNQVAGVLPALAANHHTPNILFMGNNAAGPGQYLEVLERERVVLGFPAAGGVRKGHAIRYVASSAPITLGELNGQTSPRLEQIEAAFQDAGVPAKVCENMDAWLKTHVALVSPIANALYMVGGDNHRLARTRDGIVLLIRAVREGLQVLRALNIPITPSQFRILERLPEPLLVTVLGRRLNSESAELALAGHANAARDEMRQLADEFRALACTTNVPTPAIEHLYNYIDPAVPPVEDGSAAIPISRRMMWLGLELLGGALAVAGALRYRRVHLKKRTV
jgi:2-dehydropantoate 2-reductase